MSKILILQIIYRASYVFALRLLIIFRNLMRRKIFILGTIFLIGFRAFVRARRMEPQSIRIRQRDVEAAFDLRVAFISDVHLGVFKDERYFGNVVGLISLVPGLDMLLIAGDYVYELDAKQNYKQLFSPLSGLDIPVYTVMGNHDVGVPGLDRRRDILAGLESAGVVLLNNDIVEFPDFVLLGLGPYLIDNDRVAILGNISRSKPSIVLTHNPDTVSKYTDQLNADFTLAGHTHCGQVRIPYLYKWAIPVVGDYDCERFDLEYTDLYISPGLGEVILPLRFLNPPTIDIINFQS